MEALPDNLLKICEHITYVLERKDPSEDIFPYISGLKYLFCGTPEESFFLSLTPEEKLASVLQVIDFDILLNKCPDDMINLTEVAVDALLTPPRLSFETCKALKVIISSVLKMNLSNKHIVINKFFKHKDFDLVPIDLIEYIIMLDSTHFELYVVQLYKKLLNGGTEVPLWNSGDGKRWVVWCCKSTKLFCKLSVIMNHILFAVNNTKIILEIIRDFVDNIITLCNRNGLDFIGLYPINLQFLVSLMKLNAETLNPFYNLTGYISEQLNILLKQNSFEALVILTHFNNWEKSVTLNW